MPAPTLVAFAETAVNNGAGLGPTTITTGSSVSWQTGDVVVVVFGDEGSTTHTVNAPSTTGTGLSFGTAQKLHQSTGTDPAGGCWAAVASANSSGTFTITQSGGATGENCIIGAYVFRSSAGIGNSALSTGSGRTVSLTPTGVDGSIVWVVFDWAAAALQTATPTATTHSSGSPGPQASPFSAVYSGLYTAYLEELDDQTGGGAVSYGIGGSGTGPFTIIAFEAKAGTGAAVAATGADTPPDTWLDGANLGDPQSNESGDPVLGFLYQPWPYQVLDSGPQIAAHSAETDAVAADQLAGGKTAANVTQSQAYDQGGAAGVKVAAGASYSALTANDQIVSSRAGIGHPAYGQATATDSPVGIKVAKGASYSAAGGSTRAVGVKIGLTSGRSVADGSTRAVGSKTATSGVSQSVAEAQTRAAGSKVTANSSLSSGTVTERSPLAKVASGSARSQGTATDALAGSKVTSGTSRSQGTATDVPAQVLGISHPAYSAADGSTQASGIKVAAGASYSAAGARTSVAGIKAGMNSSRISAYDQTRSAGVKAAVGSTASTVDGSTRSVGTKLGKGATQSQAYEQGGRVAAKTVAGVSRSSGSALDVILSARFVPTTAHSYAAGPYATRWRVGPGLTRWRAGPSSGHWEAGPSATRWRQGPYSHDIDKGP